MKQLFNLLPILLFIYGCVGTVQNADQTYSKINEPPSESIAFNGITSAQAISDSRIEVFFYPASGGSEKYTYDIIVGNSPVPISIPSEVLQPDYRGLLKYTLTGLERLNSYIIKVEVRDRTTGAKSDSENMKIVTTFANQVADFNGISSASTMPGQDGKDSIKIRWSPARSSGMGDMDWDPISYEIVVVDAERLTPNDMDVTSFTQSDGRWVFGTNHDPKVNEFIIRGLLPNTRYYIRMRAIHRKSVDDLYDPQKRSELNTNYVSISTLSAELADIKFQQDSFSVALAKGSLGLNAVETSWTAAKGVFDHYRLYYSQEGGGVALGYIPDLCLAPMIAAPGETVFCKKVDFTEVSSPITGLIPYTKYEVMLVLCATTECGPSERLLSPFRTIITDPTVPAFNGLKEILLANSLEELGRLYLKFDIPNFTNGYFDGLIIETRRTVDGSDAPVEVTTESPIYHYEYNFLLSDTIVLEGIDYLAEAPYCFTVYPYKWDADGIEKQGLPNDIWKCISPKPEAPTVDQFAGLYSGYSDGGVVTLSWDAPTKGVFSHYELFWRKQEGQLFNWGEAIAQAGDNFDYTNYGKEKIESDQLSFTLTGLVDGEYSFGIITYFNYVTDNGSVTIRSETNPNVLKCTVDAQSEQSFDCE